MNGMYQAAYYPNVDYPQYALPGSYLISFYPGHTVAQHFAFVGREFGLTELNNGYFADLSDELFNAVRRDPGVDFIEDNVGGEIED